MKKRVYLTYSQGQIPEPLLYQCNKQFEVVTNIRQASISDQIGIVALELDGEESEVKKAVQFFSEKGVKVEPIELDIIE